MKKVIKIGGIVLGVILTVLVGLFAALVAMDDDFLDV